MIQHKHSGRVGFELSVSASEDGAVEALYITLRDDEVASTEEIVEDILLVDYNVQHELVGIEVLGPVKLKDLLTLVAEPRREPFERFVKARAPKELILGLK